ncbi:BTAD domain-containing putative transcriptional regulator [Rhodobacter sp. CZR27]|uniref:AfsR/SARP family transcriptional regulator n=1 Tax=Rhodobacter sp. CZR27 TaxID=2033869 RepID=UPI000BBF2224|nr:BTAD domain-containing putative transcriptional regulator [Rhodobacter sp. CZR27]
MSRLRMRLLGVPAVDLDGQALVDLGPKSVALLACLAMRADGRASRAELAGLLWDDAPSASAARHALRQCLLRLRRSLGDAGPAVAADDLAIWLDPDAVDLDVRQVDAALASGSEDAAIAAAALCRGSFCQSLDLDGLGFESWLRQTRTEVDARAATLARRAAAALEARGRLAEASRMAARCVDLEPYDEAAHTLHIRLLMRGGRRQDARAAHLACRKMFRDELGIDPGPDVDAELACCAAPARCIPTTVGPTFVRWRAGMDRVAGLGLLAGLAMLLVAIRPLPPDRVPPVTLSARVWVPAEAATGGAGRVGGIGWRPEEGVRHDGAIPSTFMPAPQGGGGLARTYPIGC